MPLPTVTSLAVFKNTVGSKSQSVLVKMHLFLLINTDVFITNYIVSIAVCVKKDVFENVVGVTFALINDIISSDISDHSVEARKFQYDN